MSILCGTDFSEMSARAASAAAHLAARLHEPLHLLHALDVTPEELSAEPRHPLLAWAETQLGPEAERLRRLGADVRVHVKAGPPDEALRDAAQELSVGLIIVAALGRRRRAGPVQLGSHADRTAQISRVPVLVVRDPNPFEAWVAQARPLRIVLGVDASLSSEMAGRWISELCGFGPCEVVLAHLYSPPEEFHRLGLGGLRSYVDPDTEILKTLKQEYSERFAGLFGSRPLDCRIEPHLGRIGDGLAALAKEEKADLVVVGSRDRSALARIWQGSVARHVLACADSSVACVPAPAEPRTLRTPMLRDVLAATDFSKLGNEAIPLAYSVVEHRGTVHLVHVVKGSHDSLDPYDIFTPLPGGESQAEARARAQLAELVPNDSGSLAAATRIHVLRAPDAAVAIAQAAERLGVDLICLGTHGRTGLSKALLGSVAEGVLSHTRRPLLLARGQRE